MKKILILTITAIMLVSCSTTQTSEDTINIVATTTMLHDLVTVIGGDAITSEGLCSAGIDPHSYTATASDITKLTKADVVLYNGINLEGKLGEVFSSLESQGKVVLSAEAAIDEESLIFDGEYDPHIWYDVSLWKEVAVYLAKELSEIDIERAEYYHQNLEEYILELDELDSYVKARVEEIPHEQRVLITAHDAFSYFGRAYDFEVMGLQGINTQTQASASNISDLAKFITENKIKAIFVESSVSTKNTIALQEAVESKGFNVEIGGELYSDSLGDEPSGHNSYISTVKANIDTIVEGLSFS